MARCGIPTASDFASIMSRGRKKGEPSAMRRSYMLRLAGERITGQPIESYANGHMLRGREMEAQARSYYELVADVETILVGICLNDIPAGASPDALIGQDGLLEIKTAQPHILGDLLLKDRFPPEHKAQTQGALWICEREWIDICVYWPGMPGLIKRAPRDDAYIAELAQAVSIFSDELAELTDRLIRMEGRGDDEAI